MHILEIYSQYNYKFGICIRILEEHCYVLEICTNIFDICYTYSHYLPTYLTYVTHTLNITLNVHTRNIYQHIRHMYDIFQVCFNTFLGQKSDIFGHFSNLQTRCFFTILECMWQYTGSMSDHLWNIVHTGIPPPI